jgi:excisionase family DNA binding protein
VTDDQQWMGTDDAARYLGIVPRTLRSLVDKGDVSAFRMGRVFRYRVTDLEAYLESVRVQPGQVFVQGRP